MSNKTIAKNTLFLYVRMFFNMGISLYTSRLILQVLGVEDYGIYNLVGGVVVLFSFLNSAMSTATQRFLNMEMGKPEEERELRSIFSMSLNIHVLISLLVVVLAETVGLWFLNHKLNIPEGRWHAANVVYQLSVLTTVVQILRVPYNALMMAFERMSIFAVLSIIESLLRFFLVLYLSYTSRWDMLIAYAVGTVLMTLLSSVSFYVYCRMKLKEVAAYVYERKTVLFKSLLSFSGWSLFGQISVVGAGQGVNMLMNIFYGVTLNAAMGVANTVNASVYNFVSNIQVAFQPQIVKSYGAKEMERHFSLVLQASRFSFFLMLLLAVPYVLSAEYVIGLWLGDNVPEYAVSFSQVIVLGSLLSALSAPFWMSAYAVGHLKRYQAIVSSINLLNLPIAYVLLLWGWNPISLIVLKLALDLCLFVFRVYYFKNTVTIVKERLLPYLWRISLGMLLAVLAYIVSLFVHVDRFSIFGLTTVLSIVVVVIFIGLWGMDKAEVKSLIQFLKVKINGNR